MTIILNFNSPDEINPSAIVGQLMNPYVLSDVQRKVLQHAMDLMQQAQAITESVGLVVSEDLQSLILDSKELLSEVKPCR